MTVPVVFNKRKNFPCCTRVIRSTCPSPHSLSKSLFPIQSPRLPHTSQSAPFPSHVHPSPSPLPFPRFFVAHTVHASPTCAFPIYSSQFYARRSGLVLEVDSGLWFGARGKLSEVNCCALLEGFGFLGKTRGWSQRLTGRYSQALGTICQSDAGCCCRYLLFGTTR